LKALQELSENTASTSKIASPREKRFMEHPGQ